MTMAASVAQLNRTLVIASVVVGTGLLLVALLLGLLYVRGERPPFEYLDGRGDPVWGSVTTYQAEDSRLCPGESLRVTISFRVNRVPLVVRREYAIRGIDADGTPRRAVQAGHFDPLVRDVEPGAGIPYTVAGTLVGPALYVIPLPPLPPGAYLYEVVSSADDHPDNAFHVAFEVADCA
jgi:hypothetical protein